MEPSLFWNVFELEKNEALDFSVNLIVYSICIQ